MKRLLVSLASVTFLGLTVSLLEAEAGGPRPTEPRTLSPAEPRNNRITEQTRDPGPLRSPLRERVRPGCGEEPTDAFLRRALDVPLRAAPFWEVSPGEVEIVK